MKIVDEKGQALSAAGLVPQCLLTLDIFLNSAIQKYPMLSVWSILSSGWLLSQTWGCDLLPSQSLPGL